MAINQRDVYLLPFPLSSAVPDHLFIVLSTRVANENENTFVAVMITSSDTHYDDFSFDLSDNMFDKPLAKKNSHVRMHLITLMVTEDIKGSKVNQMKPAYFKQMMKSIGELVFDYDFVPL